MKAVFIKRDCLLLAGCTEGAPENEVRLRAGVPEGLRSLAANELLIIVLDPRPCGTAGRAMPEMDQTTQHMLSLIRSSGGQVDVLLQCPHRPEDNCSCWGSHPGFLYAAAGQLDLRLEECYLFCNEPNDVFLAYKVGCRPMLLLNGHSIGDFYDGHQPEPRDFPIARDFASAVQYVLCEEEPTRLWGYVRQPSSISQVAEEMTPVGEVSEFSPVLKLLSPVPSAKSPLLAGIPQLGRRARQWLLLFIVGGVWLSLGIAYLLTHLYRVHPFPAFVWYLTLQFIPRPIRGLMFILTGMLVVAISIRAFLHLFPSNSGRK